MKKLLVLQNIEREGPGLFLKIAKEKGFLTEIYNLSLGEKLPEAKKEDLILIMGGPMSVRDLNKEKYFWLIEEVEFIKKAIENQIPIIGVCLGAQLLSHISGGKVERLKDEFNKVNKPELGWSKISSIDETSNDAISLMLEKPLKVLHWHGERMILPPQAELLASSIRCREQLFKIGDLIYGLQFHVETEGLMTDDWIKNDKKFIISGLGENGQEILRNQCKEFESSTLNERVLFIKKLFNKIIGHKKTSS
tara:strand:+ start:2114 stop:2866 length:753 start_codon:yes stop_codon:yes gene_type:complete